MRAWIVLLAVLGILWATHLVATARSGFSLPDSTREAVGGSAATVWSRLYAQFLAPFFHDNLFHIAYNSVIFAIALPIAVRAFDTKAVWLAYLASPVVGIAVDVLIILPMARAGSAFAASAAPVRLVGASIVAFALVGMALAAQAPRWGFWIAAPLIAIAIYEIVLALTASTRPFVWAYHLGGLGVGVTIGLFLARAAPPT